MPGFIAASVWITSDIGRPIGLFTSLPVPEITPAVNVWSRPNGLPIAKDCCPTRNPVDVPTAIGNKTAGSASIFNTAISFPGSTPIIVAVYTLRTVVNESLPLRGFIDVKELDGKLLSIIVPFVTAGADSFSPFPVVVDEILAFSVAVVDDVNDAAGGVGLTGEENVSTVFAMVVSDVAIATFSDEVDGADGGDVNDTCGDIAGVELETFSTLFSVVELTVGIITFSVVEDVDGDIAGVDISAPFSPLTNDVVVLDDVIVPLSVVGIVAGGIGVATDVVKAVVTLLSTSVAVDVGIMSFSDSVVENEYDDGVDDDDDGDSVGVVGFIPAFNATSADNNIVTCASLLFRTT